jgi:heme exporter protein A
MLFQQLSFSVAGGEALLVTGPNGAGKTSLLRALAGFIAPDTGSIVLDAGASGAEDAERTVAEQCHFVGHLNAIKPSLTVSENLTFASAYLGGPTPSSVANRVGEAARRMGLQRLMDIPAGYLSAGQKRRLCLARVIVAHRPLWLLDEPTASLDTASAALVAGLIDQHVASGGLAVVVTHLPLGLARSRELAISGVAT